MNLGGAIRNFRKKKGLSQIALAKKCSLTQAYLSLIENNKKDPTIPTLQKISSVLEVPVPIFFLGAISPEDIDESKRSFYDQLSPLLNNLVEMEYSR